MNAQSNQSANASEIQPSADKGLNTLGVVREFLAVLDPSPDATFNVEHYTDLPKGAPKPNPDPLSGRYANQSIEDVEALLPKLQLLNDRGAGIFVARNQCAGHRSEGNVSRVRGVHADMDGITNQQLAAISDILRPSIVVQSSPPDRWQLYWQLDEDEVLDKAEAKAINQTLVNYGADTAAVDVSRLLRLPGFKHMKYRAECRTPTVTAEYFDCAYRAEDIRKVFPPKNQQQHQQFGATHQVVAQRVIAHSEYAKEIAAVQAKIRDRHRELWEGNWAMVPRPNGGTGFPSGSEADLALATHIARACQNIGVLEGALPAVVQAIFGNSGLGLSEKWLSRADYRRRTIAKAVSSMSTLAKVNAPSGFQLESHGDVRNARAFANLARGNFIYVATRDRWLRWSGDKWQICEKDEHIAQAKEVCGKILAAAGAVLSHDQERGKRLIQEAVTAHSLPRIIAMVKLAVSERGMAVTDRELDADPYLLGVQNGVVDLRTGHRLFNKPEMLITRYCNAAHDAKANCAQWITFLDQIFQGDSETVESVQRLLGCTLLGLAGEEILVICYGHGSNGKSVFSNVVHRIMGGYSITAPASLLASRKANDCSPRNDIASLAGARYVSINEMQAGDRLDEQVVKSLAGREPISARFLHQEFFEFIPSFTPWLRTNHKPIVTGEDDGIWRRLALLKFGRTFSDGEKNPNLENQLLAESDGILLWMIEGARKYLLHGEIRLSPRMKAEWATYRRESDLLGEFLADKTVAEVNAEVNQLNLYHAYQLWCSESGVRSLSKKSFTQRLAERGHPERKSGSRRLYSGLTLT